MKANSMLICAFLLSLFTMQANAHSDSAISGGTIHFIGTIVEGPCNVSYNAQAATMDCMRNGERLQQTHRLAGNSKERLLPANLGTVAVNWLNDQRNIGIMTIEYR